MKTTIIGIMALALIIFDTVAPLFNVTLFTDPYILLSPIMAILSVHLFNSYKNKRKLLCHLFIAAIAMFIGNAFINAFVVSPVFQTHSNLFLTLLLTCQLLYLYEFFITEKYPTFKLIGWILFPIFLYLGLRYTDHGSIIIPLALLTYIFRDSLPLQFISWVALVLLLTFLSTPSMLIILAFFPLILLKDSATETLNRSVLPSLYPLILWSINVSATYL